MTGRLARRLVAIGLAVGLVAAGCGDDDGGDTLTIGRLMPETGDLAPLGPPMIEGFRLAVEDINAAGGVLGNDVETLTGDEAGDAARARDATTRMVSDGADAIMGAAASGITQEVIQFLSDEEIVECSPSNTSPDFTEQENADYYWRTVPPDNAVAPIIADTVIQDGAQSVAIVNRADDYGNPLADLVAQNLEEAGATVTQQVSYDPNATTFDAEVEQITSGNPDAVVLVSFSEAASLIRGLIEAGLSGDQLYGADGLFLPTLNELVQEGNPNVIDGMKVIGATGGQEFNSRLTEATDGNLIYGGQAYDCVVVVALAAEAAGSSDPTEFAEFMSPVTVGGEACDSFEACKAILDDNEDADIDYNGVSGNLDLDENGDPTQARYGIAQFQEGELVPVDQQDVNVAEATG